MTYIKNNFTAETLYVKNRQLNVIDGVVLVDSDEISLYLHRAILSILLPHVSVTSFTDHDDAIAYLKRNQAGRKIILAECFFVFGLPGNFLDELDHADINMPVVAISCAFDAAEKIKINSNPNVICSIKKPLTIDKLQFLNHSYLFERFSKAC